MQPPTSWTGTVRLLEPTGGAVGTGPDPSSTVLIRVTVDADDRNSRGVVESLEALRGPTVEVEVRDARHELAAADFLHGLVCCGPVTPVVETGGLLLTAPTPAEAVLAVRRVAGEAIG